jgi:general stress protein YciG
VKRMGFASMTPERRREVSSKGCYSRNEIHGRPSFEEGSELAKSAGRKGGLASAEARRRKLEATE